MEQDDDITKRIGTTTERPVRTSTRQRKPSTRQIEHDSQTREQEGLDDDDWETDSPVAYHAVAYEALGTARQATQEALEAYCCASSVGGRKKGGDPDTLSFGQAMQADDKDRFIEAMAEEVAAHEENGNWELFPKKQVPAGHPISRGVWSMKRKRRILTGEIYKYKSRLTFDGSQQIAGLNYWDTFSPVVNVGTVRLFYNLALTNHWYTRQLDFILAYPQASAPTALFMNIPQGFKLPKHLNSADYCLKLRKNVYGNKEGGRAWYEHLWEGLRTLNFSRSDVDRCVFYRGTVIMLVYVDDCILMGPNQEEINQVFKDLKGAGYGVEDEGDVSDFLGVNYTTAPDGTVHLKQDKLVRQILHDMNYTARTTIRDKPALVGQVLQRHTDAPDHKATWNYRSIIGKLNFLLSTRPDMAYAVHNAARHSHAPKEPHSKAVQQIVRYLAGTQDKGMILRPNGDPMLEVYADAEFGGSWNKETASDDPDTARSRIGYVILYAGVPILWVSKLATEICMSVTEAEYIALSESLRSAIPFMQLLKECHQRNLITKPTTPTVRCKVFEDNSGALEMAKVPKMRPRTKHLNTKYHFFRSYVADGSIQILPIASEEQLGDIFTKQPTQPLFLAFRKRLLGW